MSASTLKNKKIYIFISTESQCPSFAKILSSSEDEELNITIICLRPGLSKHKAWNAIKNFNLAFIDFSNNFHLSKLGLYDSIRSSKIRRNTLATLIDFDSSDESILLTDNLYRSHEMTFLSLANKIKKIISIPHGLAIIESNIIYRFKAELSKLIRVALLFYLPRLIMLKPFVLLHSRIIKVRLLKIKGKKNYIACGNIQVKLSVERLQEIRTNYQETNNILFMGSGAFRFPNDVFDNQKTLNVINFANEYCIKNNLSLFLKFKKGEDIKFLKDIHGYEKFNLLSDSSDFINIVNEIKPTHIFCSTLSTMVSELLLAGFKVIMYDPGRFKRNVDSYAEIYKRCNLDTQNLNLENLTPITFKTNEDREKLKNLIGYSDVNFNFIDQCL
jgi:hypothetical protein